MDDSEVHAIDVVRIRLGQRYPDLDPEVVGGLIEATLGRLDGCRIRDFVPLLVERAATRTLDATYHRAPESREPRRTPEPPAVTETSEVRTASSVRVRWAVLVRRSPRLS
ncbi:hypothetical protein G352_01352 [Rhodococcus ruber BKS 20-38]|uniref:Uncharacterized protein n=1 Tax=Rhodococcus ruber BKS 20-38 TaxID=1278076 RepID=M2ZI38_9NOCA|nr:hypothetical protein [Rhodococcus ruber]EME66992.1 hypothetical protein G352_01352 [Rhodococcus ruber BKS 20-38]